MTAKEERWHAAHAQDYASSPVSGHVAPGFEALREALAVNISCGDDLGAQLCVLRRGEVLASLYGGRTVSGEPYPKDALQLIYSVSKGVLTICLMSLVEDGALQLDDPVAQYWPDFAQNGKESVTVRMLLGHRAGLPLFATPKTMRDLADWRAVTRELAGQTPVWTPDTAFGYHGVTFGFLVGEIIRRVTGQSPGQYLQDRFATSEGLDIYLGLPEAMQKRVTSLCDAPQLPLPATSDGGICFEGNAPLETEDFNDPAAWALENPGVNVIASAEAVARHFARALKPGSVAPAVVADFCAPVSVGTDLVLRNQPSRFGAGFMLASPREPMLSPGSFGHNGRGGSLAFADPGTGISFAYLPNRMIHDPTPHSRLTRILTALRDSLARET